MSYEVRELVEKQLNLAHSKIIAELYLRHILPSTPIAAIEEQQAKATSEMVSEVVIENLI